MMKDIETGLVGFFDILGYENLLKKNEPEDIAEVVIPQLSGIDVRVEEIIGHIFNSLNSGGILDHLDIQVAINDLRWLMFSDTILLSVRLAEPSRRSSRAKWFVFLTACIELQRRLFVSGLPLRGVVDYGRYYLEGTFFAGRPIVDAYQLSKVLDIAACVCSDNAEAAFLKTFPPDQTATEQPSAFVLRYPVPLKSQIKEMLVVRPYRFNSDGKQIDEYVREAFCGHMKDVTSSSAKIKMLNIAEFLGHVFRKDK